jgi:ubiquinone/menaquinone biosynthesis C-methylase UbiE
VLADERYVGPRHLARIHLLVDAALRAMPDSMMLDAGCGFGTIAAILAENGRAVLAFDLDRRRVRRASDLAAAMGLDQSVHLFIADATAIPLAGGAFSGSACDEVLERSVDVASAAREMARVLQPGGVLAITVRAGSEQ